MKCWFGMILLRLCDKRPSRETKEATTAQVLPYLFIYFYSFYPAHLDSTNLLWVAYSPSIKQKLKQQYQTT